MFRSQHQQNSKKESPNKMVGPFMQESEENKIIVKRILQQRKSMPKPMASTASVGIRTASKDSDEKVQGDTFFEIKFAKEKKPIKLNKIRDRAKSSLGLRPQINLEQVRSYVQMSRNLKSQSHIRVQSATNNINSIKHIYKNLEVVPIKEGKMKSDKIFQKNRALYSGMHKRQRPIVMPSNKLQNIYKNQNHKTASQTQNNYGQVNQAKMDLVINKKPVVAKKEVDQKKFERFARELWAIVQNQEPDSNHEDQKRSSNEDLFLHDFNEMKSIQILDSNLNLDISSQLSDNQNEEQEMSERSQSQGPSHEFSDSRKGTINDIPLDVSFQNQADLNFQRAKTIVKRTRQRSKYQNVQNLPELERENTNSAQKPIIESDLVDKQSFENIGLEEIGNGIIKTEISDDKQTKKFDQLLGNMVKHYESMPSQNKQMLDILNNAVEQMKQAKPSTNVEDLPTIQKQDMIPNKITAKEQKKSPSRKSKDFSSNYIEARVSDPTHEEKEKHQFQKKDYKKDYKPIKLAINKKIEKPKQDKNVKKQSTNKQKSPRSQQEIKIIQVEDMQEQDTPESKTDCQPKTNSKIDDQLKLTPFKNEIEKAKDEQSNEIQDNLTFEPLSDYHEEKFPQQQVNEAIQDFKLQSRSQEVKIQVLTKPTKKQNIKFLSSKDKAQTEQNLKLDSYSQIESVGNSRGNHSTQTQFIINSIEEEEEGTKLKRFNYKIKEGPAEQFLKTYHEQPEYNQKSFSDHHSNLSFDKIQEYQGQFRELGNIDMKKYRKNPKPEVQEVERHTLQYKIEEMSQNLYCRYYEKKIMIEENNHLITNLVRQTLQERLFSMLQGCNYRRNHEQKLIQLHDLDFKKILDPKRKMKIEINKKYFGEPKKAKKEGESDDNEFDIDFRFKTHSMIHQEYEFSTCSYKTFNFVPQLWFFGRKDLFLMESEILILFKTQKTLRKFMDFLKDVNKHGYRELIAEIDYQADNKHQYINLDQTRALNELKHISLFDIKTKTSLIGIFSELDFGMPEENQIKFDLRTIENLKIFNLKVQHRIDELIKSNYNAKKDKYFKDQEVEIDTMLVTINKKTMQNLQLSLNASKRELNINFCSKTAVQSQEIFKKINENLREEIFEEYEAQMKFKQRKLINDQGVKETENKLESLKLTSCFKDYQAASYTSNKDRYQFLHLLFKQNPTSLYNKLMYPSQDIILSSNISIVFNNIKAIEDVKSQQIDSSVHIPMASINNAKKFSSSIKRRKSICLALDLYSSQILRFNSQQELIGIDQEYLKDHFQTDRESSFYYERQGALDLFNKQYCQDIVNDKHDKHKDRVTDSMNVMYKNLEGTIDANDPGNNYLRKQFGYKSQICREIKDTRFVMDKYFPTIIQSHSRQCFKSILLPKRKHNFNTSKCQEPQIERSIVQRIDNKIFSEDAQNKRKNKNTFCQEFNAKLFNSCGFHTDGSMKGLNVNDFNLGQLDQKALRGGQDTPAEHYARIAKANEKESIRKLKELSNTTTPQNQRKVQNQSFDVPPITDYFSLQHEFDLQAEDEEKNQIQNQLQQAKVDETINKANLDVVSQVLEDYLQITKDILACYNISEGHMKHLKIKTIQEYRLSSGGAAIAKIIRILKSQRSLIVQGMMNHQDKKQSILYLDTDMDPKIGEEKMMKIDIQNLVKEMHSQKKVDINLIAKDNELPIPPFHEFIKKIMDRSSQSYLQNQLFRVMETNHAQFLVNLQQKLQSQASDDVFDLENELKLIKDIKIQKNLLLDLKRKDQKKKQLILDQLGGKGKKSHGHHHHHKGNKNTDHQKLIGSIKRRLQQIKKAKKHKREESTDQNYNPWGHFQQVDLWSSDEETSQSINKVSHYQIGEPVKKEISDMHRNVLFDAVIQKKSSFVNEILKRFAFSEELKDESGDTLIAIASKFGDELTVKALINNGYTVNTQNQDGNTPLHYAISGGWIKVADTLIFSGADEYLTNNLGQAPWELNNK